MLTETQVDPRRICFEITESPVIANMEIARQFVNGLRKIGCRFALDDFGAGLSTSDYLKRVNVDYVKLDGLLVRDVATSRVSQAMVHAVNYVAHVMGMKSIAEFVESDAIMQTLRILSVDYAQGYAVGKRQALDKCGNVGRPGGVSRCAAAPVAATCSVTAVTKCRGLIPYAGSAKSSSHASRDNPQIRH